MVYLAYHRFLDTNLERGCRRALKKQVRCRRIPNYPLIQRDSESTGRQHYIQKSGLNIKLYSKVKNYLILRTHASRKISILNPWQI